MIYYFTFVLLTLLFYLNSLRFKTVDNINSYSSLVDGKKKYKMSVLVLFSISFLVLFLIGALRKNVGIDYNQYMYNQIPRVLSGEFSAVEPLSALVFIIGAKMGSNQYIFAIIQFVIVFFTLTAIYFNSPSYSFSIMLVFITGYFNSSLNLMRQTITISMFLLSLRYIIREEKIKYLFTMIIAMLFHYTAVLYIGAYYFVRQKFTYARLFFYMAVSFFIGGAIEKILYPLFAYLGIYSNYWGETEMALRVNDRFSLSYWLLNMSALAVMLIIRSEYKGNIEKKYDIYIYIQLISILIAILALTTYIPNYDRMLAMFLYPQIISIPDFFSLKVNKYLKLFLFIFLIGVYVSAFVSLFVIKNIGGTFPYNTIF